MKKMMLLKSLIILIALFFAVTATFAEGLLPSLSETVGVGMPSLGEALQRYPDSETENEDGSITELYTNVSEADFNIFSVYLQQKEAELADYQVEQGVIKAEIRAKGASFILSYDSKNGEAKMTYPAGTFSEWMKNAKTHFEVGKKLLDEGEAYEALMEFQAIPQYNNYIPVTVLLQNDDNLAREAILAPYRTPGDTVNFGRYEQDNNAANGPEEIEWIVLDYDEKEHKALLLSKYGLVAKSYNMDYMDITWEECSLRTWLNGEFLQSAFSSKERAAILKTAVDNSKNQGYGEWKTDGGNNTQDHVFLLSYAEANRYLDVTRDNYQNERSRIAPTDYAIAQGAWTSNDYLTYYGKLAGFWWLRSPGYLQSSPAVVDAGGYLRDTSVKEASAIVCPVFWLDLESEYFK